MAKKVPSWSIELCEKNLDIPGDSFLFSGKEASHSFLRLRNPDGAVVGEIHGRVFDPESGRWGDMGLKFTSILNQVAQFFENKLKNIFGIGSGLVRLIDWYAEKFENKLRVRSALGCDLKESRVDVFNTLAEGTEDRILPLWRKALERGLQINRADLEYRPVDMAEDAQNCHSVSMDLARLVTGRPLTPTFRRNQTFAMPGGETDLRPRVAFTRAATGQPLRALHDLVNRVPPPKAAPARIDSAADLSLCVA